MDEVFEKQKDLLSATYTLIGYEVDEENEQYTRVSWS